MKFDEIVSELENLCKKYYEESNNLISVQKSIFQNQFAKKHRIDRVSGDSTFEIVKLKIKINDIVQVNDVRSEKLEVGFMKHKEVFRVVLDNGFSFLTKSSSAIRLKKGQNINVFGVVNARASGYDIPQVYISPISTFSINYK